MMETYSARRTIAPVVARVAAAVVAAVVAAVLATAPAFAQGPLRIDDGGNVRAGGEAERYLRVLQLVELAPRTPWTIRPFFSGNSALVDKSNHPWSLRWGPGAREAATGGRAQPADTLPSAHPPSAIWHWLRPGARVVLNTTFPFEVIPGPAWAGRGLTVEADGGIVVTRGRFRAQIAPKAFVSQNAGFTLAPNGLTGDGELRDARFPRNIDAPQRFGRGMYGRIDPGNSTLSFESTRAVVGISSAPQVWGPARDYPLILSANSGGFPHAFVGTNAPVNIWIGRLNARLIGGHLTQSKYSPTSNPPQRWASALVFAVMPKGLDGLEVGMARFVTGISPSGIPGPKDIVRVFRTRIAVDKDNVPEENQVASAFFRWAVPGARLEVYGEYMREDWAVEIRRLLQNPDDYGTYVLGLQHARVVAPGRIRTYRFEIVNGEASSSTRRERGVLTPTGYELQAPIAPYTHGEVAQGHTNNGLVLGSPEAFGGAAWRLGVDDYDSRGRMSVGIERRLRLDWLPGRAATNPPRPDLIYAVRAERVQFVGEREIGVTIIPMINLNRDLEPGRDKFNLSAALSVRGLR